MLRKVIVVVYEVSQWANSDASDVSAETLEYEIREGMLIAGDDVFIHPTSVAIVESQE